MPNGLICSSNNTSITLWTFFSDDVITSSPGDMPFNFENLRHKQSYQFRKICFCCWKLVMANMSTVTVHSSVNYLPVNILQSQQLVSSDKTSELPFFTLKTISAVLSFVVNNNNWSGNHSLSSFFNFCWYRLPFIPVLEIFWKLSIETA